MRLFYWLACMLGFHNMQYTWDGYTSHLVSDHGVWQGKCKHCRYRRTKVQRLFVMLCLVLLPVLAIGEDLKDRKELCNRDNTWCLPLPGETPAPLVQIPKFRDYLSKNGETVDCSAYTGRLPLLPAATYQDCSAMRLRIAMDSKGRELFTVETESAGNFVLIDHSTGHRYPFFYGGDRGMHDKILFQARTLDDKPVKNGEYVYVQND